MKRQRFDRLVASLKEVREHVVTGKFRGRMRKVEVAADEVRTVRQRSGMTQQEFAETFGIGLGTLQKWERGERRPSGAARSLLLVMKANLPAVVKALAAAQSPRRAATRRARSAA
jgi:putative transcriptional regulator